jgi:hypothetical protein
MTQISAASQCVRVANHSRTALSGYVIAEDYGNQPVQFYMLKLDKAICDNQLNHKELWLVNGKSGQYRNLLGYHVIVKGTLDLHPDGGEAGISETDIRRSTE